MLPGSKRNSEQQIDVDHTKKRKTTSSSFDTDGILPNNEINVDFLEGYLSSPLHTTVEEYTQQTKEQAKNNTSFSGTNLLSKTYDFGSIKSVDLKNSVIDVDNLIKKTNIFTANTDITKLNNKQQYKSMCLFKSEKSKLAKINFQNNEFFNELKKLETNKIAKNLTTRQTEILKTVDKKLFSLSLEKQICSFIKKQINSLYETKDMNFVAVMIPYCYKTKTLEEQKKYKRNYIGVSTFSEEYVKKEYFYLRDVKKYVFTCIDKFHLDFEKNLLVFINYNCFNENIETNKKLSEIPVFTFFFENIKNHKEFLFGFYEFTVDVGNNQKNIYMQENEIFNNTQTQKDKYDIDIIEEFKKLDSKVINAIDSASKKKLIRPQLEFAETTQHTNPIQHCVSTQTTNTTNKYLEQPIKNNLTNTTKNTKIQITENIQPIKPEYFQTQINSIFNNNLVNLEKKEKQKIVKPSENVLEKADSNKNNNLLSLLDNYNKLINNHKQQHPHSDVTEKLSNVLEKIKTRFLIEKNNGTYNFQNIANLINFDSSTFYYTDNRNNITKLSRQIEEIIKKFDIDKENTLNPVYNVIICFVPLKFYIKPASCGNEKFIKQIELQKAQLEKHYCVILKKTRQKDIITNGNGKVIVALPTPISVFNTYTDNKVIVFLRPGFNSQQQPLFDPNQFSIVTYFYSNVKNYTSELNSPLYEFEITKQFNSFRFKKDNTKNNYINSMLDIQFVTIEEYIKHAYKELDKRIKESVINLQTELSLIN